jgi:peptide chain release factor 1
MYIYIYDHIQSSDHCITLSLCYYYILLAIAGESVYEYMKFESGVHRVQRVPVNDSKIQTSAASVVIMPEPSEIEVNIRPQDLKIDLYRSQGAGG